RLQQITKYICILIEEHRLRRHFAGDDPQEPKPSDGEAEFLARPRWAAMYLNDLSLLKPTSPLIMRLIANNKPNDGAGVSHATGAGLGQVSRQKALEVMRDHIPIVVRWVSRERGRPHAV